jgi:hypothetical protein
LPKRDHSGLQYKKLQFALVSWKDKVSGLPWLNGQFFASFSDHFTVEPHRPGWQAHSNGAEMDCRADE